jgi:hypothetical protein
LLVGSTAAKPPPPKESGPGASANSPSDDSYMTLVMVNMPSDFEASTEDEVPSVGFADPDLLIQVASSDPAPFL